ncbi:S-formylglutathione hydrolase [Bacterioplanoides sp.]|uniref:S-formylglutathione hydrolase n=1 Tax=Bacterioplanoides sp. TaxID=2066072 RepID=UPI003AFF7708
MSLELIAQNKSFGGWHKQYSHVSETTQCSMRFAIFLPPQATSENVPVLYWLSGLTCTDENFMQKAGAQRLAAQLGIAIVAPDTSPRGTDIHGNTIADDENYDLGQGAGFYLNATQSPWAPHYNMYDYIVQELPKLIEANFPVSDKKAISGHSMGGHGALTIGLKNPNSYRSVSAFSPIVNPLDCPWGQKAFSAYLGNNKADGLDYDACALMQKSQENQRPEILIDQGLGDNFLAEQLKTDNLKKVVAEVDYPATIRMQEGYDHSYYFIASFIEEHLAFHAKHLTA